MVMPKGAPARNEAGQIVGTRGLTAAQTAFVREYLANGGRQGDAARAAGYASPDSAAYQLMRLPHVYSAIHAARQRKLSDLATAGLDVIEKAINGTLPLVTPAQRLDASKFAIGLAGHVAPKADAPTDGAPKDVESMTVQELEEFIRRGNEAIELARQPIIEGQARQLTAPEVAPDSPQATENKEPTPP